MSIRLFYDPWPQYHRRLQDAVATWSDEVLALRAYPQVIRGAVARSR